MSRYIDAERLKQILKPIEWGTPDERWIPEHEIGAMLDYFPAADVEEVRRGHWEKVDDNPYEYVAACSVCRNEVKQPTCMLKPIYSYCPICGAKMVNEDE